MSGIGHFILAMLALVIVLFGILATAVGTGVLFGLVARAFLWAAGL